MHKPDSDPIGEAILAFANTGINENIIVSSDRSEDDILPSAYLFRDFGDMPEAEKTALKLCSGKVLDVGAGAGVHAVHLVSKGLEVTCVDTSPGVVKHLTKLGLNAKQKAFLEFREGTFDTILLLMNGIGLAGSLDQLNGFLLHAKALLNSGGQILCDSTDVSYLYEENGTIIYPDDEYFGDFNFKMKFREKEGEWFPWVYVDQESLCSRAEALGFSCRIAYEEESHYLAVLKTKHV